MPADVCTSFATESIRWAAESTDADTVLSVSDLAPIRADWDDNWRNVSWCSRASMVIKLEITDVRPNKKRATAMMSCNVSIPIAAKGLLLIFGVMRSCRLSNQPISIGLKRVEPNRLGTVVVEKGVRILNKTPGSATTAYNDYRFRDMRVNEQ